MALSIWTLYALYVIFFKKNWRRITHLLLAIILMPSAILIITTGYEEMRDYGNDYSNLQELYYSQSYKIVEGTVHVIKVESPYGHDAGDIIQIGDVEFAINCFDSIKFAYSQGIRCGGALTEGVFARVYYIDKNNLPQILEIGVRK